MSKKAIYSELEKIYFYCKENCKEIERWPSYYQRRYLEYLSYMELFPKDNFDQVLELGCGIGYQSAFLSKQAVKVIATDLADESLEAHAPGMKSAEKLLKLLNINNVEFVACSAEQLPFEDASFDMVYSSHVLEHIPDQQKALREIYRVLKPGGIHFCVVPTRTEKVYAFFNFYSYLAGRSMHHFINKVKGMITEVKSEPLKKGGLSLKDAASSQLKYFPFPAPHGHTDHYLAELKFWTPGKWAVKIQGAAPFVITKQCSTQINPLLSLLGAVLPSWGTNLHALTRKAERVLGQLPLIRSIGINTVLICKREPVTLPE